MVVSDTRWMLYCQLCGRLWGSVLVMSGKSKYASLISSTSGHHGLVEVSSKISCASSAKLCVIFEVRLSFEYLQF